MDQDLYKAWRGWLSTATDTRTAAAAVQDLSEDELAALDNIPVRLERALAKVMASSGRRPPEAAPTCPPCACGATDARWRGDGLRVFACDDCWARIPAR